jgi:signal transduction histidine kinase
MTQAILPAQDQDLAEKRGKTPKTTIQISPHPRDYLDKIKNGLETITTLVEGILIEDRIENGMDLSCDEINISNMIQEIITQL